MKKLVALVVIILLAVPFVPSQAIAGAKDKSKRDAGWSPGTAERSVVLAPSTPRGARAAAATSSASASSPAGGGMSVRGDFDDDGLRDLAVGVPGEDYLGAVNTGVVHVLFGTPTGLVGAGSQFWSQDQLALTNEDGDAWGSVLAAGDFDADGFDDLAVGAPGEDLGATNEGAVTILFGSGSGLTSAGNQFLVQGSGLIEDTAESGDSFGTSLATGNFGNGAAIDLAVGVPFEDLSATDDGAVHVFYGSGTGLSDTNDTLFSQDSGLVEGVAESGEAFGFSVAAANFGRSSHVDLAIGVPADRVGDAVAAGAVNILYGSSTGLSVFDDQLWHQDREGIADTAEEIDEFGFSLAAANFGKSSHADLAVGVVLEGLGAAEFAGAVNVIYGGAGGLTSTGDTFWHQNAQGIADAAELVDEFGYTLAAGNFGKSGHADLAIGVPFEGLGPTPVVGVVHVLYGTTTGLKSVGSQLWHQNVTGVLDAGEAGDLFGFRLSGQNFGKSTHADLAIGVLNETIGGIDGGAVAVLYGGTAGLTATADQLWSQNSTGIADSVESGDQFGGALG